MSQEKTGAWRRIRYWSVWIVSLSLLLLLFAMGVVVVMRQFNAVVIIGLGILLYILMALMHAKRNTSPQRIPIFYSDPKDLGFKYHDITFTSQDGLELKGWFVPGRNGAGVIITHAFSDNRLSGVKAARLLVKHGYSVLLYDLRGHGQSQGEMNTWGWLEVKDVLAALAYLRGRREVDPGRIGAIGYALGGQITLRAAAQEAQIRAVWAEGIPLAVLEDHVVAPGLSLGKLVFYPWLWLAYQFQVLLTGVRMPEGVVRAAKKIAPRPLLLVAAGSGQEYLIARLLFEAAGEPKELYSIPEARSGECARTRPDQYEEKLLSFFDRALGKGNSTDLSS